MISERFTYKSA